MQDTGPGVPEDKIETLFDRFQMANDSRTREHEGSGLGLAIVREIVEHAQGKVGVYNREAGGACFWFELPVETWADPDQQPAQSPKPEREDMDSDPTSPKILIAEDNPVSMEVFQSFFDLEEYNYEAAMSGDEAYDKIAHSGPFDLILLDLHMPGMSGDQVLQKVNKELPEANTIPVVFLTADADRAVRDTLMNLGARGVLTKPIDFEVLGKFIDDFTAPKAH